MNRCITSICILAALVALCIVSQCSLRAESRQFAEMTASVEAAVADGDTPEALRRFDRLAAQWEEFHSVAGLFVNGDHLDPIREHLTGLRPLIAAEHPEVLSHLTCLRQLAWDIYEEETPEIWHIL